jgi:mannosyltransferase
MGAVDSGPRRLTPTVIALAVLTVAAAVLRFATLDVQSFWLDEFATVRLVRRDFFDLLSQLPSSESAPPLYYVLAWIWGHVFGFGPIGLRSLSALIGTATVPVAYLAARRASERAGLWAAALAAVSPLTFYYAQEARAYALLILLVGLGFVLWQRAMEAPSRGRLVAWAVLAALGLLTHYFALFAVAPEALLLLRRVGWRRLAGELAGLGLLGLALLPLALRQREDGKSNWIEGTSLPSRIGQVPKQFLVGLDGPAELATAVLALLLAAGALVLLLTRGDDRERRVGAGAAWVAGVGLALPLLLSITKVMDVFNGRNVVEAWLPAATLIAVGLGVARARRIGAALGAGLCAISLVVVIGVLTDPSVQRDDWRGIAETLESAAPATDRLVATPPNGQSPLGVLMPATRWIRPPRVVRTREVALVTLRVRRSARSSLPPPAPLKAPAGFRAVGTRTTKAYKVVRYEAPAPVAVSTRELAAGLGDPNTAFVLQPGTGGTAESAGAVAAAG